MEVDVLKRVPVREQDPKVRATNFEEVCYGYNKEEAMAEASRCLNCKNAQCMKGCPVSINIPAFVEQVKNGDFTKAYEIISESSALPAVCGRVCPQESQCEGKCIRGFKGDPVSIGKLERFVADTARENGIKPKTAAEKNGKKVAVIGSGPAGLAAAVAAKDNGIDNILILERDKSLGGILQQCIHNGFGLHTFKEELTGPEYAGRFIKQVKDLGIEYKLHTMVMDISSDKIVTAMNREEGLFEIQAGAVILAMGCRERSRGALNIPGYRPAGIYSAGTAQHLVNMEGLMPGKEVVILGSGDIGLIMARRMTLEGAKVKVVAELMPYSGGLKRNIVQCLDDYDIPLLLSHTVIDIEGKDRLTGVVIAEVGPDRKPIPGTEVHYDCDTLLLSCGLIPENELSKQADVAMNPVTNGPLVDESLETNIDGVFACGNVLHVHDLVDYVSEEAATAGKNAALYVKNNCGKDAQKSDKVVEIKAIDGVRYTVPSTIHVDNMADLLTVRFRVGGVFKNSYISVYLNDERVQHRRKQVMAPGEMEQVILKKKDLEAYEGLETITVKIEEE